MLLQAALDESIGTSLAAVVSNKGPQAQLKMLQVLIPVQGSGNYLWGKQCLSSIMLSREATEKMAQMSSGRASKEAAPAFRSIEAQASSLVTPCRQLWVASPKLQDDTSIQGTDETPLRQNVLQQGSMVH